MYYAVFTKSTDPFTEAWTKRQWGIVSTFGKSGFQVALQVAAAMERRVNHPPHAIKIVQSEEKNGEGKEVMNWSRI
jgi:hypothetical protein